MMRIDALRFRVDPLVARLDRRITPRGIEPAPENQERKAHGDREARDDDREHDRESLAGSEHRPDQQGNRRVDAQREIRENGEENRLPNQDNHSIESAASQSLGEPGERH
jgi:hypothetical protein